MALARTHMRGQRGAAAIEFALVMMVMLVLLGAIVGFGALFWMQQKLSHAAGDAARSALYASQSALVSDEVVRQAACQSATQLWGAAVSCSIERPSCGAGTAATAKCLQVRLVYNVSSWTPAASLRSFAAAIPFLSSSDLVPDQLAAFAKVQIR